MTRKVPEQDSSVKLRRRPKGVARPPIARKRRSTRHIPVASHLRVGGPLFDLHAVTSERGAEYAKTERAWLTLYSPRFVRMSLDRLLAREIPPRPQVGLVVSCAIAHGVRRIYSLDSAQEYRKLRDRALAVEPEDEFSVLELYEYLSSFRHSVPDYLQSGFHKYSFRVMEKNKAELFHLAGILGLSGSTLGNICLMDALYDQAGVLHGCSRAMARAVTEFEELLAARTTRLWFKVGEGE